MLNFNPNSSLIARFYTAIRMNQSVDLKYHTFSDGDSRCVTMTPHILKEYNNRWFLVGSACDTSKILTFALDRIDDFTENQQVKGVSCPDDLLERFEYIVGITYNEKNPMLEILFWVSDNSKDYVSTKPIHESQAHLSKECEEKLRITYPNLSGGVFFKIECRENYELLRELTSFGADLMVLSPDSIVDKIRERVRRIYDSYFPKLRKQSGN